MDVQQLRAFLEVAGQLHFGRAADRLHLAQPHLSRTIKTLEEDLGGPLFRRTTRRVELTAAGHALLAPALAMVRSSEEARAAVDAARQGRAGRVRIGFAGPSAHLTIGVLARAVRERHPLIDLEFRPGRYGTTALTEVLRDYTDLALARFAEAPGGVRSRLVGRDRCVLAVPAGHGLAGTPDPTLADLRDEPFIAFPEAYGSAVRAILVAQCRAAGFEPRFVQTAPDTWTCIALVSAGVGLHLTTTSAVAHLPRDGVRIRELAGLPPILEYLIWRGDDDSAALSRVLGTSEDLLPSLAR